MLPLAAAGARSRWLRTRWGNRRRTEINPGRAVAGQQAGYRGALGCHTVPASDAGRRCRSPPGTGTLDAGNGAASPLGGLLRPPGRKLQRLGPGSLWRPRPRLRRASLTLVAICSGVALRLVPRTQLTLRDTAPALLWPTDHINSVSFSFGVQAVLQVGHKRFATNCRFCRQDSPRSHNDRLLSARRTWRVGLITWEILFVSLHKGNLALG